MRQQLAGPLLAAGIIAAALSLSVPAAMAAGTSTVTGGPNFTAVQAPGTTITLTDSTSGLTFTCTVATAAGTVTDQSMSANTAIGSITSLTLGSATAKCHGPLGSTGTLTLKAGTMPKINIASFSGGVTTGTITNVDLILTVNSVVGTCTAEIKGTIGFKYTNSTHLLQLVTAGDNLSVTSTSGACSGIIKTGDVVTITTGSGGFVLTGSPVNPIQISEP